MVSPAGHPRVHMSALGGDVWRIACDYLVSMDRSSEALHQRFINIRHPTGSHLSTNSAKKRKNLPCNRYSNILPFDHNCVKVYSNAADSKRGKYVNASVIKAGEKELPNWSYVGAQGPLRLTVADFWLMIAEKECRVIVMLTKCLEGSENKCEPYFPQQRGDELQEPGVKVKCEANQFLGGTAIERREVSIHVEGRTEPFKCTHYHMLCWPDHGAPRETGTVRDIIRAVRDELSSVKGLACIHCSAGVGRTGTYIAIDVVMNRLRALAQQGAEPEAVTAALDVDSLIYYLRSQRMELVQSLEQYRFIFKALRDFVKEELEAAKLAIDQRDSDPSSRYENV